MQFCLPGFKLIWNDITGKGSGGVAIYLRSNVPYSIVSASTLNYSGYAEYLFVKVILHFRKFLLTAFYSPYLHVDYFAVLENLLSICCPIYSHTLIFGDFNTCLIKNNSRLQNVTHLPSNNIPSVLDLIIVSSPDLIETHGQLPFCFSYHDLLYLSTKISLFEP